jgi:hypothetical protein
LTAVSSVHALELKKGDHVAIVGSALADRQQHFGWLEAFIHKAYPELDLTVRNLGFAGDEFNLHPRSDEVPPTEYFLDMKKGDVNAKGIANGQVGNTDVVFKAGTEFHAGVILAYWGFNESFKGESGLAEFRTKLDEYLKTLLRSDFGAGRPRIVLFSPIAHENLRSPNFGDGAVHNGNLGLYAAAMADVAKANGIEFVDLFTASTELYRTAKTPLTINGIHLNQQGDQALGLAQGIAADDVGAFGEQLHAGQEFGDLASGRWQRILGDSWAEPTSVNRVLLCSGKVYYELDARRQELNARNIAILRVEQLYPLTSEHLAEALAPFPTNAPVIWVQEEPANMGAWTHMRMHFSEVLSRSTPLRCISRPASASPATGSSNSTTG